MAIDSPRYVKTLQAIAWYCAWSGLYMGVGIFMLNSRWSAEHIKDEKARNSAILWYLIGGLVIAPIILISLFMLMMVILRRCRNTPATNNGHSRHDLELGLRNTRSGCHPFRPSRSIRSEFHPIGLTRSHQTVDSVFPSMNTAAQQPDQNYNHLAEPAPAYRATVRSWPRTREHNVTEI